MLRIFTSPLPPFPHSFLPSVFSHLFSPSSHSNTFTPDFTYNPFPTFLAKTLPSTRDTLPRANPPAPPSTPSFPNHTATPTSSGAYSNPLPTVAYWSTHADSTFLLPTHAAHAHVLLPHHVTQPPSHPSCSPTFATTAYNSKFHNRSNNSNKATDIGQPQHTVTHSFIHNGYMPRNYHNGSSNNNPLSPARRFYKTSSTPGGFTMPSSINTSSSQLSYNFSTPTSATNPTACATVPAGRNASGGSFAQVHVTATTQHVSYNKPSHHTHQTTSLSHRSLIVHQAYLACHGINSPKSSLDPSVRPFHPRVLPLRLVHLPPLLPLGSSSCSTSSSSSSSRDQSSSSCHLQPSLCKQIRSKGQHRFSPENRGQLHCDRRLSSSSNSSSSSCCSPPKPRKHSPARRN